MVEATKISFLSGVSRITLNKLFKQIRILIAKECENISKLQEEIEIDESYFLFRNCKQEGVKRIRGKRGRGAGGKTPVFFTHTLQERVMQSIDFQNLKALARRIFICI